MTLTTSPCSCTVDTMPRTPEHSPDGGVGSDTLLAHPTSNPRR